MNCPACGRQGTVQWTPPTYSCSMCKHVLTKREYERAIRGGQLGNDVARIIELEAEIEALKIERAKLKKGRIWRDKDLDRFNRANSDLRAGIEQLREACTELVRWVEIYEHGGFYVALPVGMLSRFRAALAPAQAEEERDV